VKIRGSGQIRNIGAASSSSAGHYAVNESGGVARLLRKLQNRYFKLLLPLPREM